MLNIFITFFIVNNALFFGIMLFFIFVISNAQAGMCIY